MKRYKYDEWDCTDECLPEHRIYKDLHGNPITGIIEGFYRFSNTNISDDINCKYINNGRILE